MDNRISVMKYFLLFIFFILFLNTAWSGPEGMSEEQMQQFMEQAQKMQECMEKIDQSAMDKLTNKAQKMDAEIKSLCAAGKRKEAQNTAIQYSKEIINTSEMQEMRKCSEMAKGMMQQMSPDLSDKVLDPEKYHVCDEI